MRKFNYARFSSLLVMIALGSAAVADEEKSGDQDPAKLPTVAEKTDGMEQRIGFLTFYVDDGTGKIWLEIPPPGERGVALETIYLGSLQQGMGSNPVGLDRGLFGGTLLLEVRRIGNKVLFEQSNPRFRALSDDLNERRAVRESFATSVLWGAEIAALDSDGRSLVDLSSFLLRDTREVAARLKQTDQGEFSIDAARSAIEFESCLAFPDNIEMEALVTWAGKNPGGHVRSTVPTPHSLTLRQHHSFVRPPQLGEYQPRPSDPRIATINIGFQDYAVPLDTSIHRSWVVRHRLEKTNPGAARSNVVEPIVFYVDSGAPEPIRSALVEGASWWAEAFDKAGFIDGFVVEILPPDAHPLDVRYNVIQWVHRSTRGWSYGNALTDPRTGEILKGHVNLGSLRVRQDRLLFEGLVGTENTGSGSSNDPIELSLARLRQLSAHEVGHALGFAHNFAGSRYDDRASVMDYPAPLVGISNRGDLDLSRAYGVGIGAWDIETVRYSYSQFAPGADESKELHAMVQAILSRGHLFIADSDSRPLAAADSRGSLWDNGKDAVAELEHSLRVREIALKNFGPANILPGRPLAELEEVLVPVYFHHRFQLDAAIKDLGGSEVSYAVRGDGQAPTRLVPAGRQRAALSAVLAILEPRALDLPESLLTLLAPRAYGMSSRREVFASATAPSFDALGAAATAAEQVVSRVLHPARLERLQDFNRRFEDMPGVGEVVAKLVAAGFSGDSSESQRHVAVRQEVQRVIVDQLMISAVRHESSRTTLRAELEYGLATIRRGLDERESEAGSSHRQTLMADIDRFFDRRSNLQPIGETSGPAEPPPGSPIGTSLRFSGCSRSDH